MSRLVHVLQNKKELKESSNFTVQTEDMDRMWCVKCEYPAEDLFDLGEHMYEYHAEKNECLQNQKRFNDTQSKKSHRKSTTV